MPVPVARCDCVCLSGIRAPRRPRLRTYNTAHYYFPFFFFSSFFNVNECEHPRARARALASHSPQPFTTTRENKPKPVKYIFGLASVAFVYTLKYNNCCEFNFCHCVPQIAKRATSGFLSTKIRLFGPYFLSLSHCIFHIIGCGEITSFECIELRNKNERKKNKSDTNRMRNGFW